MDRKTFNALTKKIFSDYGFIKEKTKYVLLLKDVTIAVRFASWRGVKYFSYIFSINKIHDRTLPYEDRSDCIVEIKMEHTAGNPDDYRNHEISFEQYTEEKYRTLLTNMLHAYFDPYKVNALQFIKDNADTCFILSHNALVYLFPSMQSLSIMIKKVMLRNYQLGNLYGVYRAVSGVVTAKSADEKIQLKLDLEGLSEILLNYMNGWWWRKYPEPEFAFYTHKELWDKIEIGEHIKLIAGSWLYCDCAYPIVGLYKNGEEYLDYETGKKDYIEWLKKTAEL